jgi:peptidoglycan hydrolase-like protein with peptidoglycan-binding domain
MKIRIASLILLGSIALARADQAIESAQQALKDQGFYYGEITGEKSADTTAAIRRYQIRNGLQVTGDLNDETLKSLGIDSSAPRPVAKSTPALSPVPDTSDLRAEPRESTAPTNPLTGQPFPVPQDRQPPPPRPEYGAVPVQPGGYFAGTPYEMAPPDVQRNVIVSAQTVLARRGLYHDVIDGLAGPNFEFSLRAYQSRFGLPLTGRLDLETLAALQLLPGANAPVYVPRRRPFPRPPVRGEWIDEQ